jgi:sugar lactone lactonase YvrE
MGSEAELISDDQAELGEGAIWDSASATLYWVDITAGHVHSYHPETGARRTYTVGQMVGTVVPRAAGGLLLAVEQGLAGLDLATGVMTPLWQHTPSQPGIRFNDGKCDPIGRFWAGTMALDARPGAGSLYRFDPDGSVHTMVRDVTVSNGLTWSLDNRTFYYIDTPTQAVAAFEYNRDTGAIANRREVIQIDPATGAPDGMTIDTEGMLWIAHWDGSRVTRWNPADGSLLQTIRLPVARVTSCWFGGPNLNELYITTASIGLSVEERAAQPHAGGLFRYQSATQGLPAAVARV